MNTQISGRRIDSGAIVVEEERKKIQNSGTGKESKKSNKDPEKQQKNKKNQNSRKKWMRLIVMLAFVAFNITVIVMTAVNEFSGSQNAAELAEVELNGWLVLPAALCFMGMITLEYRKYVLMIMHSVKPGSFTRKEAWRLAFRTVMVGRYYDMVTPAAVGGQPAQILGLRKTGKIPDGLTTAIPIFSMIAGQATFLMIAVPCFLLGGLRQSHPALLATGWIGLAFYAFWPAMVTGTVFFPKFTAKFINLVVKLLHKVKIVKDHESTIKRVEKEVEEYARNVKLIAKSPIVFGGVLAMSLLSNVLLSSIPFFVLEAFGGDIDFFECYLLTVGVQAAVYFAPTPGNSGVAEGTFYVVFSRLSTGYVFWAMMLWRVFSYYIYIIVGPIIFLIRHFEKRKAAQAQKSRVIDAK